MPTADLFTVFLAALFGGIVSSMIILVTIGVVSKYLIAPKLKGLFDGAAMMGGGMIEEFDEMPGDEVQDGNLTEEDVNGDQGEGETLPDFEELVEGDQKEG